MVAGDNVDAVRQVLSRGALGAGIRPIRAGSATGNRQAARNDSLLACVRVLPSEFGRGIATPPPQVIFNRLACLTISRGSVADIPVLGGASAAVG